MMWQIHMEKTDGVEIKNARNGCDYMLPHFSVDGYCPESNTVHEFCGCFWNEHPRQQLREVITASG